MLFRSNLADAESYAECKGIKLLTDAVIVAQRNIHALAKIAVERRAEAVVLVEARAND